MAEKENKEKMAQDNVPTPLKKDDSRTTKMVRNRSGHRIELVINERVVVFLPGKTVEIPADFDVPNGLGLRVR